jgi:hypothetical protein
MKSGIATPPELAEEVGIFLREQVLPVTDEPVRFLVRVAARAVETLGREIEHGDAVARAHAARLQELGVQDDAELARAIRAGDYDGRWSEVVGKLRTSASQRLSISNPGYLLGIDR